MTGNAIARDTTHALAGPALERALAEVREAYQDGRYLDALERGRAELGELRQWPSTAGRVLAARLAFRVGAPRLNQALTFRAYRDDPEDEWAAYLYASLIFSRRGPWHALRQLRVSRAKLCTSPNLLAAEAHAYAVLRDFDRAHASLERASRLAPGLTYLPFLRSVIAEQEDDLEGALRIATEALGNHPGYRLLLHQVARLRALRGDGAGAYEVLGVPHLTQSWELLLARAHQALSIDRFADAEADLIAAAESAALVEPALRGAIDRLLAVACYRQRAHRRAERHGRAAGEEHDLSFADALHELEDGAPCPRVELEGVPFVRQRHSTCVPASLVSIAAYFGDAYDHDEVTAAVCYEGTPSYEALRWAREHGYTAVELDLTLERARALVDAGFPVLLTTSATTTAHAQVVVGYDQARRTLLIRDPSVFFVVELAEEVIESQRWQGPHAMVMVPAAREAELDALDLGPSVGRWERLHELSIALQKHDLAAARAARDALGVETPGDRLALTAALLVARYEGRGDEVVRCLDGLLELHPDTPSFVLQRAEAMRGQRPRDERIGYLTRYAHLDDPFILETLAEEERLEGALNARAERRLHRALRLAPTSGVAHHILADLLALRGDAPDDALESYRFGACLALANEHFLGAYFDYARARGRDDEALEMLKARVARAKDRASGPARTLYTALADSGNPEHGVEVLGELATQRAEDGDLALLLAGAHLEAGDPQLARDWLEEARRRDTHAVDLLLMESRIARIDGDLDRARDVLEEACALQPERVDANVALAHVLDEQLGPEAAIEQLEAARAHLPHDGELLGQLCVRLRNHDVARSAALLEERLSLHRDDTWARRELALVQAERGELDAALATAREAVDFMPYESASHVVLGTLALQAGDVEGARASLRRAVELDVDNDHAIRSLTQVLAGPEEAREDARFVLDELERKVSSGPGVIAAAYASASLPADERKDRLERLLARAPHRPDAWEAVIRARLQLGEIEQARAQLVEARGRFPRWLTLGLLEADVLSSLGERQAEEKALRALVEAAPLFADARARLVRFLREEQRYPEAHEALDEGFRRAPRSSALNRERALTRWEAGERGEAFEGLLAAHADRALDDLGLRLLTAWALPLDRVDEVEALLREAAEARPRSAVACFRIAELLARPEDGERRIEACREALDRQPRYAAAADLLAETLASLGRFDEALAACPPEGWTGPVPEAVEGRRAWVLAMRGDVEDAVKAMEAVLERAPDYAWGRQQLCEWLDQRGDTDRFAAHAEALARHAPGSALSHVYLGDARVMLGDDEGARAAFSRAHALDPGHTYGAYRAFRLHLDAHDIPSAEAVLAASGRFFSASEAVALDLELDLAHNERGAALSRLGRLLSEPVEQATLERVLDLFAEARDLSAALGVVRARLHLDEVPSALAIGGAYAAICARHGRPVTALFAARDQLGPAGREALAFGIEEMGAKRRWPSLIYTWLRHGRYLRAHAGLWGAFGFALLSLGWARLTARWLSDYPSRSDVRPWMLLNLTLSLWELGRRREAERAVQVALALGEDHATERLRIWQRFHRALDGDIAGAAVEMASRGGGAAEAALTELVRLLEDARGAVIGVGRALGQARHVAQPHPELVGPLFEVSDRIRRVGRQP